MQVIPLEELGRPRVDVVVNCSGVFRDLFVNQMILLDRAIKLAAEQDEPLEMNFVRKHAIEQVMFSEVFSRTAGLATGGVVRRAGQWSVPFGAQ